MQTPTAPGAHPLPCAFQTACRMHLRTPSSDAIGAAEMRQLGRQRVLRVHVLAAAALQNQLHLDLVAFSHCSKWMIGVPGPRLLPEFSPVIESTEFGRSLPRRGRFGDRLADLLLHHDLIGADRRLDLEGRHAGVLADRAFAVGGQVDVLRDDRQRLRRLRAGGSSAIATFIAARTSGGRSVDVRTMSESTLSKKAGRHPISII